jgi:hypothetical protein
MNDQYFGPNGYDFTLATAYDDTPNDRWTDINMINNGIHVMIYHGHGLIHKWSFGMGVPGLPQLNNTVYPIILSFACLTGSFSGEIGEHTNDCLAQKMVANEHGAVAFLGSYHKSGRGMNLLLEGMVNSFFNDSITKRLGDALIYGLVNTTNTNTVNEYYPTVTMDERIRTAWQFHLFGDPALSIRIINSNNSDKIIRNNDVLRVYPNPTNEYLRIEANSNYEQMEIAIYSLDAQMLLRAIDDTVINISNLISGCYLVKITRGNTNYLKKLIKL